MSIKYTQEQKRRIQRNYAQEGVNMRNLAFDEGVPPGSIANIIRDPYVQLDAKDVRELGQAWAKGCDEFLLTKNEFLNLMKDLYPTVPRQAVWEAVRLFEQNLRMGSVMDSPGVLSYEKGVTNAE